MKKAGYVFLTVLMLFNIWTVKAGSAETIKNDNRGTISVTGTASDSFPPDMAEIVLAVESSAKSVSGATQLNRTVSGQVVNKLKTMIHEDRDDQIKTSSYSLQPEYEYDKQMRKNILTGYRVFNQVTVKTGQINEAGPLIDSAIDAGANRVISVSFTIADNRAYCKELLGKATDRGKMEAETVAESLGVNMNGIKNVSASCGHTQARPFYRADAAEVKMMAATPVEPGAVTLSATANIIFYIMNR